MAKYANLVEYNIKTSLDASGITKLQSELNKVQTTLNSLNASPKKMKSLGLNVDEVQLYQEQIQRLSRTISECFNSKTGMLNINKFNTALKSGSLSVAELNGAFKAAGNQGKAAFNSVVTMMTNINKQAITVNSTMAKIANTFSNTVRWGITASIFQEMMGSIQGAVSYMKNLDESLTQIQMVTNSSKENMRELAQYANNAAQALGSTTVDYTNAVKVFVQEGFSESESKQYANLSTKLANVSEQSTAITSDQITAFRNAFQLSYEETVAAMDKVANVANNTASNVNELMTASQRAASVAQAVGSSQESFLAAIATIESVTRQSAEEIGNGLKTIYQRFADIKAGGKAEDGVDYGQYAKALKSIGVDVLDAAGEFKGMDQILKETQEVWSSLSDTMKIAVGEKVAGKFQYNRFAALMNNPDYYQKALSATGAGSEGMMDQMNEIYMESIEGRLKTLQAAGEQVMSTLFDQDTVEPIIEDVTEFVNSLNSIIEIAGGGIPVFTALSALLLKAFSPQIASQITQIATNIATITQASSNMKNMQAAIIMAGQMGKGLDSKTYDIANRGMSTVAGLNQASQEKMAAIVQQVSEAEDKILLVEEKINELASQLVEKYQARLNLTEEEAVELQTVLVNSIKNNESQNQIKASIRETLGFEEESLEVIKLTRTEVNNMTQAYKEMNSATLSLDQNLNAANTAIQGFQSEQIARGFTQALSAVTSLAFGIQSMVSWWKIMNDETASFEEKMNATLISFTMGISMLGSAITSITSGINAIMTGILGAERVAAMSALTVATDNYTKACINVVMAQKAANMALKEGNIEGAKIAAEKVAETIATREKTKALQEEAIAQAESTGLKVVDGKVASQNIAITISDAIAKKFNTEITIKSTLVNKLYAFSLKAIGLSGVEAAAGVTTLGSAIAAFALPIIAITELITLLILSYKAWEDAIHSANKQYEKQNELLKESKKIYDTAKDSVDQLKNSIDALSKKQEDLEGLTKGTKEWKEAVRNLNEEVLTLVENYPELLDKISNNDGVLTISSEDLDNFYQERVANVSTLRDSVTIQQARTLSSENNAAIENFSNRWGISKDDIRTAISEGNVKLSNNNEKLNIAFADLIKTIDKNNAAIESTTQQIGVLGDFVNYAGNKNLDINNDYARAKKEVLERYGVSTEGDFGYRNIDFSELINDSNFKEEMEKALGSSILSMAKEGNSIKFELANGQSQTLDNEAVLDQLALTQTARNEEQTLIETNESIYKNFGVTWDKVTQQFVDANGKAIHSLSELTNITDEQRMAIEKLTDSNYNSYMSTLYGSTDEFAKKIKEGSILSSSEFADQEAGLREFLNNESFQQIASEKFNVNTLEEFTEAVKNGTINLNGLSASLEGLTPKTENLKTNINGNEFTNRIDISSNKDAMKKLLDDADMDETAFNRMARDSYEEDGGYYQQEKQRLEELIAVKEKDTNVTEEEQEELSRLRSELDNLDDSARDTSAMLLRMSNGVVKLRNNIDDISEILTNEAARGTTEWYEALDDLDEGLSDVLNIDAGTLSDSFLESGDALDYARRMAEGDMTAIDDLRIAASQDIIQNLAIQVSPEENIDTIRAELMAELNQLQADIDAGAITITSDLDDNPFIQKLNHMLQEAQISEEQASNILSSIGMEATIQHATGPGFVDEIEYEAVPSLSSFSFDAGILGKQSIPIPSLKIIPHTVRKETQVDYPYIQGAHYTGPGVQTANTAARNPNYTGGYSKNPKRSGGGGNKGGSGGSGKDTKPKDKDKTEWDYLTDITNDLDRAAAVMEKLSKLEDRLYGSSRVSQIKKLQKEYKNYIGLLEQEVKLAENHAQLLRNNAYDENGNLTINGYGYRAGVGSLQFDAQNNLENGKEIEARLVDRVNAAIDDYNAHRNADDASYYEERVSLAQKDHEGFLKALSEYESTLGKIEDGQSQIQDYKEKIQDATDEIVDAIQDGIEDVLEAIDNQRDFNKMYRDWMQGGNGYSHLGNQHRYYTEGLEGLLSPGQNGISIFDMQLQSLQDRIEDFKGVFDGDSQDADDEKLSEQAAFENLQEATKNIMGSLEKAVDYYDSLLETVQDASDKMDELIDDRLDEFNNLEDYLDTRLDQLKLLFGDKSYEQQAQLYNEKIAVNMEKMVSINTAIEAKQATVKAFEGLEESGKELSTEERKELKDARNKVTSLQKEQLDTESQLLQDIANRLGNQVNAELDTAINNLFGGEDIDWLTQQWELSTRFSEQYLDDYNRAFELQKLQIKYQELLNDTQATSAMAQQRISAQMTQQLKYLREKNHLSEYDVEYAEKKLEILQREFALEDARNNKSQMRLQRNAAGNYDFVYAADEDAINDAKMALLNAQQEAYNLSKKMYKEIYDGALKLSKELKQMVFDIATDASLTTEQQAERIKWIMENTSEYLGNASVELGEVSVNLYNDIADAEQLIAEENLGNLADIFEIMRAQSKITQESIGQDLSSGGDNAINVASDTFGGIQGLSSGTQKAVSGDFKNIEGSLNKMLSNSYTNVNGTITKIVQGSSERSGDIIGVIGNIDKNFGLSVGNMLTNTENIDKTFKGAFDNIAGDKEDSYLNQYKNKTTEVLKQAGEEYDTFTEQSINYATEQLELLRQSTQDWEDDLDMLKQMIRYNTDEIKGWKTEIGLAMEASKDFITESNNLQIAFGEVGTMAMIAGSMFDDFGEAAYGAGAAVDTMSHDIERAYYSIRDAAEAAAQAYNDMAWAADNARNAANNATLAALEAQDAIRAVDIGTNIGSTAVTIANNAFNSFKNTIFGKGWGGGSYNRFSSSSGGKFATGGYTGTWTDQGIDDKSGKWAILHQKELVLNADDTKNMLSAVEVVRDIMSNINSLPSFGKITTQNNLTDTIEQRVEINATFPGVTEAIQIKQALEQIADNAYQVANKYKY